jgi:hypothetical protein
MKRGFGVQSLLYLFLLFIYIQYIITVGVSLLYIPKKCLGARCMLNGVVSRTPHMYYVLLNKLYCLSQTGSG